VIESEKIAELDIIVNGDIEPFILTRSRTQKFCIFHFQKLASGGLFNSLIDWLAKKLVDRQTEMLSDWLTENLLTGLIKLTDGWLLIVWTWKQIHIHTFSKFEKIETLCDNLLISRNKKTPRRDGNRKTKEDFDCSVHLTTELKSHFPARNAAIRYYIRHTDCA